MSFPGSLPSLGTFAFADRMLAALRPLDWSSRTYLTVIVVLLLLHLLVSWPEPGLGRFVEEICLILPAGLLSFSVRGLERTEAAVAFDHPRQVVSLERSRGVVDTVALRSNSYDVLQPPTLTNIYASMPSLHVGWNLLVGIAIARHACTLVGRLVGILLPIAMFAAIVLTANDDLVDGIVGGAFALTALIISAYATAHWSRTLNHISLGRLWTAPPCSRDLRSYS